MNHCNEPVKERENKNAKKFEEFMVKHYPNLILFKFRSEKQKYINSQINNNLFKDKEENIKVVRER